MSIEMQVLLISFAFIVVIITVATIIDTNITQRKVLRETQKSRKILLVIVDLGFGVLTKPEREEYLRIRGCDNEEVQEILQKNIG